ncbi:MAG: cytochrome c oxidase subunit 3, partial [Candidatus Eisenbacteria bacterium]
MSEHIDHPSYLGHHYETAEQQFDSGKLGMWLFLATEILLFAGLFCAYAVYRSHHPEIFEYAHQFLDKKLGGINTVVLITSSFTMAMAVRAAQLGQRGMTSVLLVLTLLGACGFLGIKKMEYEAKWKHGLLWGERYHPSEHGEGHEGAMAPGEGAAGHGAESGAATAEMTGAEHAGLSTGEGAASAGEHVGNAESAAAAAMAAGTPAAASGAETMPAVTPAASGSETTPAGTVIERSTLPPPAAQPEGLVPSQTQMAAEHGHDSAAPKNVHIFFGIYFLMTGLHGLHVIAGMIAIGW